MSSNCYFFNKNSKNNTKMSGFYHFEQKIE